MFFQHKKSNSTRRVTFPSRKLHFLHPVRATKTQTSWTWDTCWYQNRGNVYLHHVVLPVAHVSECVWLSLFLQTSWLVPMSKVTAGVVFTELNSHINQIHFFFLVCFNQYPYFLRKPVYSDNSWVQYTDLICSLNASIALFILRIGLLAFPPARNKVDNVFVTNDI